MFLMAFNSLVVLANTSAIVLIFALFKQFVGRTPKLSAIMPISSNHEGFTSNRYASVYSLSSEGPVKLEAVVSVPVDVTTISSVVLSAVSFSVAFFLSEQLVSSRATSKFFTGCSFGCIHEVDSVLDGVDWSSRARYSPASKWSPCNSFFSLSEPFWTASTSVVAATTGLSSIALIDFM